MIEILFLIILALTLLNVAYNYLLKRPNYNLIKNKTVLITGASSGLGKALAFKFYENNCTVIMCARNYEALQKIKNEINSPKIEVFKLDITDPENVGKVFADIFSTKRNIDVLVNNAGVSYRGEIVSSEVDVFKRVMDVNFFGQVNMIKSVLPNMINQRCGIIVGIGSVQGKIAIPFRAPYTASKHACQAFYDSLRSEVYKQAIEVLNVNPGYIQTNISRNALTGDGSTYGKLDANTSNGMDVDFAAQTVLDAICLQEKDVLICPFHHKLAVLCRTICPSVFFWIMRKRAGKKND